MGTSNNVQVPIDPEDTIPKWRFAGLDAPEDGNDSSYFTKIDVYDTSLFVLDARGRVWEGAYGSDRWELLKGQPNEIFFSLNVFDSILYLGALQTGRLYGCNLKARKTGNGWEELSPAEFRGRGVFGIGSIGNGLVATVSSRDTLDTISVYRQDPSTKAWRPWGGAGWPKFDAAPRLFAWNGKLYAATWEHGLWRRGPEESGWERLPDPKDSGYQTPNALPRSMAAFAGDFYVGYFSGSVYRLDTAKLRAGDYPWVNFRSTLFNSGKEDLPLIVLSLFSYRDRFYAAGKSYSTPMYFSDAQKKWRWLGNFCPKNGSGANVCGGTATYGLVAIKDTLFAAGDKHIMKFPLEDVPP